VSAISAAAVVMGTEASRVVNKEVVATASSDDFETGAISEANADAVAEIEVDVEVFWEWLNLNWTHHAGHSITLK
jgi:hypothetical protein